MLSSNGWQRKKEGKTKTQKFEYLKDEKSFLDEIKNIFHSFWRLIIWWRIKIPEKIANTSFKQNCVFQLLDCASEYDLLLPSSMKVLKGKTDHKKWIDK